MPPVLQILQQQGTGSDRHQAILTFTGEGWAPRLVTVEFGFSLSDQDREDIRWYLEDYLEFADDPAPRIAARIERRMEAIGDELFRALFQDSDDARDLWAALRPRLGKTRIEVVASVRAATTIPWELLRDPRTGAYAALEARAFVRGPQPNAVPAPGQNRGRKAEKVRILLAICRPKGGEDVPFRSVAGLIAKGLTGGGRDAFDLHVLRPPTFDQLAKVLRQARDDGAPFHAVHFDGHGLYADPAGLSGNVMRILGGLRLDAGGTKPAPGRRGLLLFEDPDDSANAAFVDGFKLGGLLRETGVPILILNACQSAFAEAPSQPATTASSGGSRETVEAYGSLAQAVLDAGTAGVVAMRYSVYVVTAAQFVAELYDALTRGRTLGEAVSLARKHLYDKPKRAVAFDPRPLQDWSVPVVWERQSQRLWPASKKPRTPAIRISSDGGGSEGRATLDRELPARPDVGFYGRDETLYAIDRGFDANLVVLLHAYAGAGKTATAAEFARWYRATSGVQGPVLFSSFERHLPLVRLLDKVGQVFEEALAGEGIQWDAITDPAIRRGVALHVLAKIPVLWIWDNVEPVAGFPAGVGSEWSAAEQHELVDFLRDATEHGAQAKFLITSRREEQAWLGNLPMRVAMQSMPMRERLQLAHALVARRGLRPQLPDLRALLSFTQGNPLTILVTIEQAMREGIDTKERLEAYIAKLRAGAQEFTDETEGRDKNLAASLSYGFSSAFSEEERRFLSLLYLFQGFVDADALCAMGNREINGSVGAVRGWARDRLIALLDRAAEVGLLIARGGGYYGIHPALSGFFRDLFTRFYTGAEAHRARCAFAHVLGHVGRYWASRYGEGDRAVLGFLAAEEENLRAAWALAREQGMWEAVTNAVQGLQELYRSTGRSGAWRRLVEAVAPDFIDPASDGPVLGREEEWRFVTGLRVDLLVEDRDWSEAQRLLQLIVKKYRRITAPMLAVSPEGWDTVQRNRIHTLAASLERLGRTRIEQQDKRCITNLKEAMSLYRQLHLVHGEAISAFNLGHAYLAADDVNAAERWYRRSLDLRSPRDYLGRAKSLNQLGNVALMRFEQAESTDHPAAELLALLNAAASHCRQALDLLPSTAITDLGVVHDALGRIYRNAGTVDRALHHYQQSIRYAEASGGLYAAGSTRYNAAVMLFEADRLPDARDYAQAATANFRAVGERTTRFAYPFYLSAARRGGDDLYRQAEELLADIDTQIGKEGRQ
jgi:tetratricopeptide (TPR) repeat protein